MISIPRSNLRVVPERIRATRHVQDPISGRLRGRRVVPKAKSDKTSIIQVIHSIDVNKDGKIDKRDVRGGLILGRGGMPKRIVVERYATKRGPVRSHYRRIV